MSILSGSAEDVIAHLGLVAHPEGGYYRRSHASTREVDASVAHPDGRWTTAAQRPEWTAIYFLLKAGEVAKLHELRADEMWAWHAGGSLNVVELLPGAPAKVTRLGSHLEHGEVLMHVVPAGTVFGASMPSGGAAWCLVSAVVIPGFHFDDWSMPRRSELLARFPGEARVIEDMAAPDIAGSSE